MEPIVSHVVIANATRSSILKKGCMRQTQTSIRLGLPRFQRSLAMTPWAAAAFFFIAFSASISHADDQDQKMDAMMKAASLGAGPVNNSEQKLYQQSIESTKGSIAHDTLDVFYKDAVDLYHERQYDQALELLDQIYSVDPNYENVASLRDSVRRIRSNEHSSNTKEVLDDYMRKGEKAFHEGKNVLAISIWKQALTLEPDYAPAKKRIRDVNHQLAQRQFETGYLHYHHEDMEDALDCWSNAIALDPTYNQRGLLTLMSKVQLQVQGEQVNHLVTQAEQQYQQGDLPNSLQSYQQLLALEPRHEEARRMSAKIKIQLGQAAFKSARENESKGMYADAIKDWESAIQYDYEPQRSQKAMAEAEDRMKREAEPKVTKHTKPAPDAGPDQTTPATTNVTSVPPTPTAPVAVSAEDEASAAQHYRQGLLAFKSKNCSLAITELQSANALNPSDEHIYIAYQRAQQECKSSGQ